MPIIEEERKLFVVVCWKGLSESDEREKHLQCVYEDVPILEEERKLFVVVCWKSLSESDERAKHLQ